MMSTAPTKLSMQTTSRPALSRTIPATLLLPGNVTADAWRRAGETFDVLIDLPDLRRVIVGNEYVSAGAYCDAKAYGSRRHSARRYDCIYPALVLGYVARTCCENVVDAAYCLGRNGVRRVWRIGVVKNRAGIIGDVLIDLSSWYGRDVVPDIEILPVAPKCLRQIRRGERSI